MRGAQAEVAAVAVLQSHELRAVQLPAPGFLPQLGGLQGRHEQLLAADAVHLLAHDLLDLRERALAQRQERVDPGGGPAHQSGAQQHAVRGRLGLGGVLLERGRVQLAHADDVHGFHSVIRVACGRLRGGGRDARAALQVTPPEQDRRGRAAEDTPPRPFGQAIALALRSRAFTPSGSPCSVAWSTPAVAGLVAAPVRSTPKGVRRRPGGAWPGGRIG